MIINAYIGLESKVRGKSLQEHSAFDIIRILPLNAPPKKPPARREPNSPSRKPKTSDMLQKLGGLHSKKLESE